jgi:hypothetical protein
VVQICIIRQTLIRGNAPVRAKREYDSPFACREYTEKTFPKIPSANVSFVDRLDRSTYSPQQSARQPQEGVRSDSEDFRQVLWNEWLGDRDSNPIRRSRVLLNTKHISEFNDLARQNTHNTGRIRNTAAMKIVHNLSRARTRTRKFEQASATG